MATQELVRRHELGVFFTDIADLARQLADRQRLAEIRDRVWQRRGEFTFDRHADELVTFFRQVIAARKDHPAGVVTSDS